MSQLAQSDSVDSSPRWYARPWLHVLAVTGLGLLLRALWLGRQSPWIDEAWTAYRISGSFNDLITSLGNQGFGPLWYAMLFGFARAIERLTGDGALAFHPGTLRWLPAVLGTAVVPAMYLLARETRAIGDQSLAHRWAMVAAFLAAINPYAVYYARDLKMYGLLLTLFTLHLALLWRFSRTGRWTDWLGCALSFAIAAMVHGTTWLLLPIQLITAIVRRRGQVRMLIGCVAAWLIAAVGPALWYTHGTQFLQRFAENKDTGGLMWIRANFAIDRNLLLDTPALFITGLGVPVLPPSPRLANYYLLESSHTEHPNLAKWIGRALLFVAVVWIAGLIGWFVRCCRDRRKPIEPPIAVPPSHTLFANEPPTAVRVDHPRAPAAWLFAAAALPIVLVTLMSLPPEHAWSIYPHYMIYQPRYVATAWPAMLLLLAVAIRHLPSFRRLPIRAALLAIVAGVLLASALTNHFTDRLPPHVQMAAAAKPFVDPQQPRNVLLIQSVGTSTSMAHIYAYSVTFGHRPQFDLTIFRGGGLKVQQMPLRYPIRVEDSPRAWSRVLRQAGRQTGVSTLVISDRLADKNLLGDEDVTKQIGPGWNKAHERRYRLNHEWHPYLSHGYRTRVWVKPGAARASSP